MAATNQPAFEDTCSSMQRGPLRNRFDKQAELSVPASLPRQGRSSYIFADDTAR